MKKLSLFLSIVLIGCTTGLTAPESVGVGALGTVATEKVVEKIKKVVEPQYKLYWDPIEICSIKDDPVVCHLVPCDYNHTTCTITIPKKSFIEQNEKIITVRSSQIENIMDYCNKNKDFCLERFGFYKEKSQKIILVTKDE